MAGLASIDPNYPIHEWDRLLPQAEITVNLLRTSRLNPNLSAYALLNGNFDFNRTPMAPPGTKVVMHTKPKQRSTWGNHGEDGFYTGPALEHYRCVECISATTRRVRVVDTVQFFPHNLPFPEINLNDRLTLALDEIINTLQTPEFKTHNPTLQLNNQTQMVVRLIAGILKQIVPVTSSPDIHTKL